MSDNEIRQILIAEKRKRREAELKQRRRDIMENIGDAVAWICWAALGYGMFLGAYMIG